MNYQQTTGKTILHSFQVFHKENPEVYDLFKRYAFQLIHNRKKKISSKLIINRIRWEVYIKTKTDDPFRINDIYSAHYARLFVAEFPAHSGIFNFRKLRSGDDHMAPGEQVRMKL